MWKEKTHNFCSLLQSTPVRRVATPSSRRTRPISATAAQWASAVSHRNSTQTTIPTITTEEAKAEEEEEAEEEGVMEMVIGAAVGKGEDSDGTTGTVWRCRFGLTRSVRQPCRRQTRTALRCYRQMTIDMNIFYILLYSNMEGCCILNK